MLWYVKAKFLYIFASTIVVLADPLNNTHFSAQMLVNLSSQELLATPANVGTLDIFVYRITQGLGYRFADYMRMIQAGMIWNLKQVN